MRMPTWAALGLPVVVAVVESLLLVGSEGPVQLGTALFAAAVLPLRRRWPWPVLLATLPALWIPYLWSASIVALYTVARYDRRRWAVAAGMVLVIIFDMVPYPLSEMREFLGGADVSEVVLIAGYSVLTGLAPAALGLLVRTRSELEERLCELQRSQASERELMAEKVLATERARLAREMHDVVAHQVSLISVQAGALQVAAHDAEVTEAAAEIRRRSVATLGELRHMVAVLRASGAGSTGLAPQPTLADLPRLIAEAGPHITADLSVPDEEGPAWPEPLQRAAFRIVQEALTNAGKHAPGAPVRVRLGEDEARLRIDVDNDAPTAPPLELPSGGHGLAGLRERALSLGGTLRAGPTPGGGYRLTAQLPLRP
ncbi:sensor histidine kinase [Nocardiopsis gilva]